MPTPATYYSNCASITPGCYLYSNLTLTPVPPGSYSNGFVCWNVGSGGIIISQASCPPTTTTTTNPGCLVAGTMVNMLDGTFKPVEEIIPGDSLLSINSLASFYKDETFEIIETLVLSLSQHTSKYIIDINFGALVTSDDHIHVIKTNGVWGIKKAFDLVLGDVLIDKYNNEIPITTLDVKEEAITVYNIQVDNQNVYFANNILTHNKNSLCCLVDDVCSPVTSSGSCATVGYLPCDPPRSPLDPGGCAG
jgi:hypothetical protein